MRALRVAAAALRRPISVASAFSIRVAPGTRALLAGGRAHFSSSPPPAPPPPPQPPVKPRAVRAETPSGSSESVEEKAVRLAIGVAIFAGIFALIDNVFIDHGDGLTPGQRAELLWGKAVFTASALARQTGLTPKLQEEYAREVSSLLPPVATLQSQRRPWRPTLVLQLEGVCLTTPYDPATGYGVLLRPGFIELLLAASMAGVEVVLWSSDRTSQAADALFTDKVLPVVIAADKHRYMSFCRKMRQARRQGNEEKMRRAAASGAAGVPDLHLDYDESELEHEYVRKLLSIHAVLGNDHGVRVPDAEVALVRGGVGRRGVVVKDLAALPRNPRDILLVDCDVGAKRRYPHNTLLVPALPDDTPPSAALPPDPTLAYVGHLLTFYHSHRKHMLATAPTTTTPPATPVAAPPPPPLAGAAVDPEVAAGVLSITEFLHETVAQSQQKGLRPRTGKPLDETIGVLGVVAELLEESDRQHAAAAAAAAGGGGRVR